MRFLQSVSAKLVLGALAMTTLSGHASAASESLPKKPIFDATCFLDGPNADSGERVRVPDTYPVRFVYGFEIMLPENRSTVSREAVRQQARPWANEPPALTVIDIEHIPIENVRRGSGISIGQVRRNQNLLSMILDSVREEAPGLRLGYFDLLPAQHMFAWQENHHLNGPYSRSFEKAFRWVDPHTQYRTEYGYIDRLDFLAPAIYLHPQRIERYLSDRAEGRSLEHNVGARMIRNWIQWTVEAAREAQKPIYPVIWHRVHDGPNPDANGFETREYVGDELYRLVIETALEHADGVILWSDAEQYNEDDPWHDVVAEFTRRPVATISFDADRPGHRVVDATAGPGGE